MKKFERFIIYPILILLLFAVFYYFFCKDAEDKDNASFILAVFTILVTVLIGWQIFSLINIENIRKGLNRDIVNFEYNTEKVKLDLYSTFAEAYKSDLEKQFSDITAYRYIVNHLSMIITLNNLQQHNRVEVHIDKLVERFNTLKPIYVPKEWSDIIKPLIIEASQVKAINSNKLLGLQDEIKVGSNPIYN